MVETVEGQRMVARGDGKREMKRQSTEDFKAVNRLCMTVS